MRLAPTRGRSSKPNSYSGRGRPKKHDKKFKVNDQNTWWSADETIEIEDPKLGKLKVSRWDNLHFRSSASHDMSLIQVQRLGDKSYAKKRRPLWLVWVGEQFLELKDIWRQYARRFERRKCVGFPRLFHFAVGVDHWYRFAKQRLHWTLPNFSTAKQSERWSDLMPLMTWQLWLAKDLVEDHHLPWQSPQKNLTPGRVAQSIFSLLIEIDTPATSPKTRGKSILLEKRREKKQKKDLSHSKKKLFSPEKRKTTGSLTRFLDICF